MKYLIVLLLILCSFSSFSKVKKEKHAGKVVSIMGNYEGQIKINLTGENEDQIEIELGTVTEKSKGSKYTQKNSITLNVAAIRSIEIEGKMYVIRNIEFEMNKFYNNCCVQQETSTKMVTLYNWQQNKKTTIHALQFNGSSAAKTLQMPSLINMISTFRNCKTLYEKIRAKENGYVIDANATEEERYIIWKKLIEESNNCPTE
jgi:hypothetical protein